MLLLYPSIEVREQPKNSFHCNRFLLYLFFRQLDRMSEVTECLHVQEEFQIEFKTEQTKHLLK
jgi:hypothetical protein